MTFRMRGALQDALAKSHAGTTLASLLAPLGKSARYDSETGRVRLVGFRDQVAQLELNEKGNPARLVSPLGRETRYLYEGDRAVGVQVPTGLILRTQYDTQGRVARSERSDGQCTELAYDDQGNLAALRTADGALLRLGFGSEQRLERVRERDGGEVARSYDHQGMLESVTDPLGRVTQLSYGVWSEPARVEQPDGNTLEYVYRADAAEERVNGEPHALYELTDAGKLSRASYTDGYKLGLEYDEHGRLVCASSPDAQVKYDYDQAGRVVSEAQSGGLVRYAYTAEGQLSSVMLPDGRKVEYHYDLDGRVSLAHDWTGQAQIFWYGAGDHPLHRTLPSGLVESYQLDLAGRVEAIDLHNRREAFWSRRYERDVVGRISAQADSRVGKRVFGYDARSRLLSVEDAGTGHRAESYAYDLASQRVGSPHSWPTFDAMCRPVQDGATTYAYDALGNRMRATSSDGSTQLAWAGPNLLREVRLPDGTLVHYAYDALGRRVRKQFGQTTTVYLWAGHQLVQEQHETSTGSYTVEYMYWPGSHRPLAKCEAGQVFYYHCDQLDTPQLLTDAARRVAWSADYSAFGTARVDCHAVAQPLRFPGQYWDAETDLHYNRARYYDPGLGVYLSRDPLAPLGENAYVYAGANPVNVVDPLGLFWEDSPDWFKTAASIGTGIVVGVALAAAVVAFAPASLAVGAIALVVGGVAGGATAGALGAGMTEGGCVPCGAKKGAALGLIGALPFLLAPAGAGIGLVMGLGAASGALTYGADCALYGHEFKVAELAEAVAAGVALGVAGHWVAGKIAPWMPKRYAAPVEEVTGARSVQPDPVQHAEFVEEFSSGKTPWEKATERFVREDDRPFSAEGKLPGRVKSHVDDQGNVRPANPDGKATVVQHVRGAEPAKSDSPYTSFKSGQEPGKVYGANMIEVDAARLRQDIASGKVKNCEIVESEQVVSELSQKVDQAQSRFQQVPSANNAKRLQSAIADRANAQRDGESLIRGTIPSEYVTVK